MSDTVHPGHVYATPDLAEARAIVLGNQGVFGTGQTATDLLRVIEWFVEPPCVLVLEDGGGCVCIGDAFQFEATVSDPNVPKQVGHLRYDVSLTPGSERVHLDLYMRDEDPPDPPMSMRPHLKRVYQAMERVGIPTFELEAGLDGGPTFWAYAGVDFVEGRPLLEHLELLAMILAGESVPPSFTTPEDVRTTFSDRTVSIRDAHRFSLALSRAAGVPEVVRVDQVDFMEQELGIDVDEAKPIGEAILFALSPWKGRVDLSAPGKSDARFRAFLGL